MKFRREMIPQLVVLAEKGQYLNSYHTMQHILQLLFFYQYLTQEKKRLDPFDPKLIDLLPVMVKVSERLLKNPNSDYRREAMTYRRWLNCGDAKLNPFCEALPVIAKDSNKD